MNTMEMIRNVERVFSYAFEFVTFSTDCSHEILNHEGNGGGERNRSIYI
jgi:hypothetical protein